MLLDVSNTTDYITKFEKINTVDIDKDYENHHGDINSILISLNTLSTINCYKYDIDIDKCSENIIYEAFKYAEDNDINIIYSTIGIIGENGDFDSNIDRNFYNTINYYASLFPDILFIFTAGNNGKFKYIADIPDNVIYVGELDYKNNISKCSDYGDFITCYCKHPSYCIGYKLEGTCPSAAIMASECANISWIKNCDNPYAIKQFIENSCAEDRRYYIKYCRFKF